uniref:Uncharacterized protein n=1 Tax=Pipistrellus kuhlii TaxID=59472 RepID=A0A7J7W316_PIPKU|nr:hypothetical protein mPipKuh1_008173 [Pipistrellus kuhlii]
MRERHRSAASCTPPTGDVPTTKVHALDRNQTWDLSVHRPTFYPLSQTGFGHAGIFSNYTGIWENAQIQDFTQEGSLPLPTHCLPPQRQPALPVFWQTSRKKIIYIYIYTHTHTHKLLHTIQFIL